MPHEEPVVPPPEDARVRALTEQLDATRAQVAAYALALDVLGRVSGLTDAGAVADAIVHLFTMLFAPGEVRLEIVAPPGVQDLIVSHDAGAPRAPLECDYELDDARHGFRQRLTHDGHVVGVIELLDLAHPLYRDRYVNTALTIAPVCAMLIVHARALRGLIPICSYCKSIRDSQGTWHELETYITEHSEALFSHGVCPRCLERVGDG